MKPLSQMVMLNNNAMDLSEPRTVKNSRSQPFSQRVLSIEESSTVATSARAGALQRQGVDLVSLVAGEPDFDTPQNIKEAAIRAIQEGKTKYTLPASGIPELKQAICDKLWHDNGLACEPSQIIVTCGAKQTIFDAIVALINPGDEAIIPAPYWVSYADQVRLMGGNPVIVQTDPDTGYCMTAEQLRRALSPRTKFLLLNSPCNPTGQLYSRQVLRALAEVVAEAGIYVISDEIYEKLLYDGAEHVSIAAVHAEVKEKTLVVNGMSKAYAMTGWRVGYGAGPEDLIRLMAKIQTQETTNTCTISQYAALEALTGPQDSVETMRRAFEGRRNAIVRGLNAIPGITCPNPRGAFYVFPNVFDLYGSTAPTGPIQNNLELCDYLLEEAKVAGVPGEGFGAEAHIRFTYAAALAQIERAVDRIGKAVSKLV